MNTASSSPSQLGLVRVERRAFRAGRIVDPRAEREGAQLGSVRRRLAERSQEREDVLAALAFAKGIDPVG
jgi:CelD/BcsL family acetyltransferase involved in cellulose biosynthesis